jgi:hypothetical protein
MSNERNEGKKMNQKFSSELGKWRLCDKIGEKPFMKAFVGTSTSAASSSLALLAPKISEFSIFATRARKSLFFISEAGRAFC